MSKGNDDDLTKEIEDIKKLLILHLVKSGASKNEIRTLLNISGDVINKLIPFEPKLYLKKTKEKE